MIRSTLSEVVQPYEISRYNSDIFLQGINFTTNVLMLSILKIRQIGQIYYISNRFLYIVVNYLFKCIALNKALSVCPLKRVTPHMDNYYRNVMMCSIKTKYNQ